MHFDAIVLVGARAPVLSIYDQAKNHTALPPVTRIGDCNAPGTIQAAVLSGHMQARQLLGYMPDAQSYRREHVSEKALRI